MTLKRLTDTAVEPVTADVLKSFLVGVPDTDAPLLRMMTRSARHTLEALSGQALCLAGNPETWEAYYTLEEWESTFLTDGFLTIPVLPVVTVVSITERRVSANEVVAATVYHVDAVTGRIYLKESQDWPHEEDSHTDCAGYTVNWTAGHAAVPSWAEDGITRVASYLYEHNGELVGTDMNLVAARLCPLSVRFL